MAKAAKKPKKSAKATTKQSKSDTRVTRITASDSASASNEPKASKPKSPSLIHKLTAREKADKIEAKGLRSIKEKPSKAEEAEQKSEKQKPSRFRRNPFGAITGYFKGAWYELRQVRWPDRSNTLKMTGALLVFTAFIGTVILLLDWMFQYLFELMIG